MAAHVNRFANFVHLDSPTCSEQVQRVSISGVVSSSFVASVWGVYFYDCWESEACCGESVDAWKSDNPYDGNCSPVAVNPR